MKTIESLIQSFSAFADLNSEQVRFLKDKNDLPFLAYEIDGIFKLNMGDRISTISTVFEDNMPALILATTDPPRMTPRSKHMGVKYHWFRSHLSPSTILVKSVPSASNKGDIFTKALARDLFERHRKTICGW